MIFSPGILALMAVCLLLGVYALYAAGAGLRLLAGWDPRSSTEAQLTRERKTSLLSSLLALVMILDLLCLGFFVTLADRLHGFFPGAMCAAGMFNANAYGYPTLGMMLAGFILCVLWLIVNHLDALAADFALIRVKYAWLVPVALVLALQAVLLANYFLRLNPALITSCCGTSFGEGSEGIGSDLAHLSPRVMEPLFWVTLVTTLAIGWLSLGVGTLKGVYAALSVVMLPLGLAAIVSFISVRIYELPGHHCPFCLLQPEYHCLGYPLYAGLLLGTTLGIGAGLARWCGRREDTRGVAVRAGRRLTLWSLAGYGLLGALAAAPLLGSDFRLHTNTILSTMRNCT